MESSLSSGLMSGLWKSDRHSSHKVQTKPDMGVQYLPLRLPNGSSSVKYLHMAVTDVS